jgi:hypothetical protein
LSETGIFQSVREHRPATGIVPYEVNAPLWSDGASKERLLALPGSSQIAFEALQQLPLMKGRPGWVFPDGTVLVKTFSLELEAGNPQSSRRIETRLLHLEKMQQTIRLRDQYWRGYSYAWNEDQSDAELVEAAGRDRNIEIRDAAETGGKRTQTWHYPSRAECTMCHSMPPDRVISYAASEHCRLAPVVIPSSSLSSSNVWALMRPPTEPAKDSRVWSTTGTCVSRFRAEGTRLSPRIAQCHVPYGGGNRPSASRRIAFDELGFQAPPVRRAEPPKPHCWSPSPERSMFPQ